MAPKIKEKTVWSRRKFLRIGGTFVALALATGCFDTSVLYDDSVMARELYKVRPLAREITQETSTIDEAVAAVVQWTEKNFFHYYLEPGLGEDWGPKLYAPNDDSQESILNISIEDVFRERAVGCHLATFVLATMLRSIGIYANHVVEWQGQVLEGLQGHGVLSVPGRGIYVHGDLVAELAGTPAAELMQTERELRDMSVQEGSYTSIINQHFERYWLWLHRSQENELYVAGTFKMADEQETQDILAHLAEYQITLQPEDNYGRRWVNSARIPIQELVW